MNHPIIPPLPTQRTLIPPIFTPTNKAIRPQHPLTLPPHNIRGFIHLITLFIRLFDLEFILHFIWIRVVCALSFCAGLLVAARGGNEFLDLVFYALHGGAAWLVC